MSRWISWLWHELTRPRGRTSHRFYRGGRGSRSGVALMVVLTGVLFLTVMMTQLVYSSTIRIKLAANHRDEVKAEALAMTGLSFYRLLLVVAKGIDKDPRLQQLKQLANVSGISGDMIWQMVPVLNTGFLRMLFVSGGDVDQEEFAEGLTEEQVAESRESNSSKRSFLDFDGDFYAEVTPEEKRINVSSLRGDTLPDLQNDPHASQLHSLMTGVNRCNSLYDNSVSLSDLEEDDNSRFFYDRNLEPWELIGNLRDWTDPDGNRVYLGGDEDGLYDRLENQPYKTKNAPFDTLEELRLVDGWHRDDLWDRFGEHLTVYGAGKINIQTAECEVMSALVRAYFTPTPNDEMVLQILRSVEEERQLMGVVTTSMFVGQLQNAGQNYGLVLDQQGLRATITDKSTVFRVTSVGQVNESIVTIEAVFDFSQAAEGKVLYWRVR